MLKETNELNALTGSAINSGYRALSDGKLNLTDFAVLLDPLLKGEAAVQGIGSIPAELADASTQDKDAAIDLFEAELSNAVPVDDQYDIAAFYAGITSAVSMIGRRTKKEVLEKLAVKLNGPAALSEGDWTAEKLSALLE